jgi:hypothetical protein
VITRAFPRWTVSLPAALASAGVLFFPAGSALADEPRNATEPHVMMKPGEVTRVIEPLARLHRPRPDTIEIADLLEEAKAGEQPATSTWLRLLKQKDAP